MTQASDILTTRYRSVRRQSETLCEHLDIEDLNLQAMAETSPLKWHLAHTSWFFETFILKPFCTEYSPFDARYEYLFNSYYNAVGKQFPRAQRHILSRPTVSEVMAYRRHIDELVESLLAASNTDTAEIHRRLVLGLHHEQQHQELMLTDLKYNFSLNPAAPAYLDTGLPEPDRAPPLEFIPFSESLCQVGFVESSANDPFLAFCFDNETPRHQAFVPGFAIANRLTTNAEYLDFISDGGYEDPQWWSSDGWACVQKEGWQAPLYWSREQDRFYHFTLHGKHPVHPDHPVCHVSLYEAHAFANWSGKRLCREQEWEYAAQSCSIEGNFQSAELAHPVGSTSSQAVRQLFGDVWEWTQSAYTSYPGYKTETGALGEYNGKFMMNQYVLRGGSIATPPEHIRASYRNFFYPADRWQFSGIRLAQDLTD